MVKIKDFTLASKNRGGGTGPPCPTHLPPMAVARFFYQLKLFCRILKSRKIPLLIFKLFEMFCKLFSIKSKLILF